MSWVSWTVAGLGLAAAVALGGWAGGQKASSPGADSAVPPGIESPAPAHETPASPAPEVQAPVVRPPVAVPPAVKPSQVKPPVVEPPAVVPAVSQPPADQPTPTQDQRRFEAVPPSEVPEALRDWVSTQVQATKPAYQVLSQGDATYVAVTGGLRSNGGYKIDVIRTQLPEPGGKPVAYLDAKVTAPRPDQMVVMVLTNPVKYFRITPVFVGTVAVTVTAPE